MGGKLVDSFPEIIIRLKKTFDMRNVTPTL